MFLVLINIINRILGRPLLFSAKHVYVAQNPNADGVIFLRKGVHGISLGDSNYAQVRIALDDGCFVKGLAVYKDYSFFPNKNIHVVVNIANDSDKILYKPKAIKPLRTKENGKIDWDNPFGCTIKRRYGALNIVSEQGDWADFGGKR